MEYVVQIHEDYVAEANIAPAIETLTRIYEKALSREIEKNNDEKDAGKTA